MADWDADDFDPDADGKLSAPKLTDKWDGEDEDDDIKVRLKTYNMFVYYLLQIATFPR